MRVLIVEDSAAFRSLINQVCTDIGLDAVAVASAEEALSRTRAAEFDLYIVDLHLGDIDGLELCRRLRKLRNISMTPIILLTSDQGEQVQQRAFDAGISEIILKTEAGPLQDALRNFVDRIARRVEGRVLYIEDSRSVASLMLAYLQEAGLIVDHFTSAEEALEYFGENPCDLVISDIVVEGSLSGIGLLRAIRALDDPRRNTPFLALSASVDTERRVLALRQGADDFITKPVHREELIARSSNLITRKRLMDTVLEQQRELQVRAITDDLTGLYNKAYLNENGRQMLSAAQRHGYPLSLMVIDLDFFKQVNDKHGHDTGDRVLEAVGRLLGENCRNEDLAARFGGEEFTVLLPHCSLANACRKAEHLREKIAVLNPAGLSVTTSIGVTGTRIDETLDYETLFSQADKALYRAKEEGRNRVVSFRQAPGGRPG